jgi:hypothetical protein
MTPSERNLRSLTEGFFLANRVGLPFRRYGHRPPFANAISVPMPHPIEPRPSSKPPAFRWERATRQERAAHSAIIARAERLAAGLPPQIEDESFYRWLAEFLIANDEADRP